MFEVDIEFLADVSRLFNMAALCLDTFAIEKCLRSCCRCDLNIRLAGTNQQVDAIFTNRGAGNRFQVLVAELMLKLRTRIDDASVNSRSHCNVTRPVFGS